jgi:hypothetical protein
MPPSSTDVALSSRERALEGIPAKTRALALEIALKTEISDDDPLWLLFIAASVPSSITQSVIQKLKELETVYGSVRAFNKDVAALMKKEASLLKKAERVASDLKTLSGHSNRLVLQQWLWLLVLLSVVLVCSSGWFFTGYFHSQKQVDGAFGGNAQRNYAQLLWSINQKQIQQCQEKHQSKCEINLTVLDGPQ